MIQISGREAYKKSFRILDRVRAPSMALEAYAMLARGLTHLAPWHLQRRLARGREDPLRWREKLGHAGQERPAGRLIWLHGVGLGEVMALRAVIAAMGRAEPNLSFLVTSSARSSAQVIGANLQPRTVHQYLPLDIPRFVNQFLDHWQPDLSIWSDQEIWPWAVAETDRRAIPLVFLNARITDTSLSKRKAFNRLYRDVLSRFQLVLAQDQRSAENLTTLGAQNVIVSPSVKSGAPMLAANPDAYKRVQTMFKGRRVWVAASTHPNDEAVALAAQAQLYAADTRWLLILVPRDPKRDLIPRLPYARRSANETLDGHAVYLADTFGELGLWYRLGFAALVGGSFSPVEGHNPWEAAALGCAVLHGSRVENFKDDYKRLHEVSGAREVRDASALVEGLTDPDLPSMALRGQEVARQSQNLDGLATQFLRLLR